MTKKYNISLFSHSVLDLTCIDVYKHADGSYMYPWFASKHADGLYMYPPFASKSSWVINYLSWVINLLAMSHHSTICPSTRSVLQYCFIAASMTPSVHISSLHAVNSFFFSSVVKSTSRLLRDWVMSSDVLCWSLFCSK